ncbi:hypothetical protein [Sphingomonas sp.]|uniref:hypothetical protein n=1 Tax=Sphingomonas sp. TaxID=28214 RepID=UPI003AFFAF76
MTCGVDDPNVKAFLKLIRYAEHYPVESDNWYDSLYGGKRFVGYQTHPNSPQTRWGKTSTAAGAYQILIATYNDAHSRGIMTDFTPASQDRFAFWKIGTRGARDFVCAGDVRGACGKLVREWVSLPGGSQSRMTMAIAEAAFVRYGGTLKT